MICLSLLCISVGKTTKKILLVIRKFIFVYVDIWFDMTKCRFIVKNNSLKFLDVFWPIFVEDTKINFLYNFIAPLKKIIGVCTLFKDSLSPSTFSYAFGIPPSTLLQSVRTS